MRIVVRIIVYSSTLRYNTIEICHCKRLKLMKLGSFLLTLMHIRPAYQLFVKNQMAIQLNGLHLLTETPSIQTKN
jgi:hypothetical protein